MTAEERVRAAAEARAERVAAGLAVAAAALLPDARIERSAQGVAMAGKGLRWRSVVDPALRDLAQDFAAERA